MQQFIEIGAHGAMDYLRGMIDRGNNLRPVLLEIGEDVTESTKKRFDTATDPDGQAWAPNSDVTLARYSSLFARKKDGSLTKASAQKLANKKPGTGETRMLATTINYQVHGADSVGVGSPMIYAATFHYGAKSGEFGFGMYLTRNGSFPIPWGDIPSRKFLGLSAADKVNIGELVRSYMLNG
jgi:phage gpG-like protein